MENFIIIVFVAPPQLFKKVPKVAHTTFLLEEMLVTNKTTNYYSFFQLVVIVIDAFGQIALHHYFASPLGKTIKRMLSFYLFVLELFSRSCG